MRPRIAPREAILKPVQIIRQLRLQATNLFGIHASASKTQVDDRPQFPRYLMQPQHQLAL
jgi:hypothetical protein